MERSRNAAGDGLLQFERVGKLALKPFGLEGARGAGIDELHICSRSRSDFFDAACQDIAYAEFASERSRVD